MDLWMPQWWQALGDHHWMPLQMRASLHQQKKRCTMVNVLTCPARKLIFCVLHPGLYCKESVSNFQQSVNVALLEALGMCYFLQPFWTLILPRPSHNPPSHELLWTMDTKFLWTYGCQNGGKHQEIITGCHCKCGPACISRKKGAPWSMFLHAQQEN